MAVVNANAADYAAQLFLLQPAGPAWPQDGDSTSARVFPPIGTTLAQVHARANQLIEEADARTTSELLVDWERVVGLPDPCLTPATSTAERRRRVVQRLTYQGGQSVAFFIAFLAVLGYPGCTVTEYRPLKCNSKCNAPLNQGGWRYGWRVNVPGTVNVRRLTCTGRCNDPIASWGDPGLLCLISAHRPAHTKVFVSYGV